MSMSTESRIPWGLITIGIAVMISTYLAASAWERVKTKPPDRSIQITGSAKRRIVSDQIEWSAYVSAQHMDRTIAYRDLHNHIKLVLAYLDEQGIKKDEVSVSSASVSDRYETEYVGIGAERIERQAFKGYVTNQTVTIRSKDVARIERVSRQITELLDRGISISSSAPSYFYTKLGELKIEMLAEASRDARNRAENIVKQAEGAVLGRLRSADMGVINVNPVNSTSTSWEGNNDTTSLEKDIITIVHITFELN